MKDWSSRRKLTPAELAKRQRRRRRARPLPLYVVCDNIRSLWNVGSIFRTADGAAVEEVILCGTTGMPPREEISKTALGAEQSVPWSYFRDTSRAILSLQGRGVAVWVLEQTQAARRHDEAPVSLPLALVVGNEVEGVSPEVVARADGAIEIPLLGTKESLNVSVALGIALFEIVRRTTAGKKR